MTKTRDYIFLIFICTGILFPHISLAKIIFTEIAWMGDADSASHEWIELTNTGTASVDVTGWQILATDGSPTIDLEGTIMAGQSVVLERTSDESAAGTAFLIYSGALANTGETLTILDASSQTVDSISGSAGWPSGDNDTKETAQWNGSVWITKLATPGSYVGPIKSEALEPVATTTTEIQQATTTQASTEPVAIINQTPYRFELPLPEQVITGQNINLLPEFYRGSQRLFYGNLRINFGDGRFYDSERKITPVTHQYQYPGKYLIAYELRSDPWSDALLAEGTQIVEVVEPLISIRATTDQIFLSQETEFMLDISNWLLNIDGNSVLIPPLSFLSENQVTFKTESAPKQVLLYDNNQILRAEYNQIATSTINPDEPVPASAVIVSVAKKAPTTKRAVTIEIPEKLTVVATSSNQSLLAQANMSQQVNLPLESGGFPWWKLLLPVLIFVGLGLLGYLYWMQPPES